MLTRILQRSCHHFIFMPVYNGIHFYPTTKTEAEFIKHEKHHGLTEAELKEVWALMNPKKKDKEEKKVSE